MTKRTIWHFEASVTACNAHPQGQLFTGEQGHLWSCGCGGSSWIDRTRVRFVARGTFFCPSWVAGSARGYAKSAVHIEDDGGCFGIDSCRQKVMVSYLHHMLKTFPRLPSWLGPYCANTARWSAKRRLVGTEIVPIQQSKRPWVY